MSNNVMDSDYKAQGDSRKYNNNHHYNQKYDNKQDYQSGGDNYEGQEGFYSEFSTDFKVYLPI